MTLEQDAGIDGVELSYACQVNIGYDSIEDEVEVIVSCLACINVVEGYDTVKVIDIFPNGFQYLQGLFLAQRGNLSSSFTNIQMCLYSSEKSGNSGSYSL